VGIAHGGSQSKVLEVFAHPRLTDAERTWVHMEELATHQSSADIPAGSLCHVVPMTMWEEARAIFLLCLFPASLFWVPLSVLILVRQND
jgi:hypothetical protein